MLLIALLGGVVQALSRSPLVGAVGGAVAVLAAALGSVLALPPLYLALMSATSTATAAAIIALSMSVISGVSQFMVWDAVISYFRQTFMLRPDEASQSARGAGETLSKPGLTQGEALQKP
jgi:hypothetical protein